jgi:hypothetical protein
MNVILKVDMALVNTCSVSITMSFLDMLLLNAMLLVTVTNFVECCGNGMKDAVDS